MPSEPVPTAPRGARLRRKISDTTALSLFIQEPTGERGPQRARARSARVAAKAHTARMTREGSVNGDVPMPRPHSTPLPAASLRAGANGGFALARSPSQLILQQGGLRVLSEMSVFLNQDDHIILADAESGMAALVTGVTKVGDAELAVIAGAFLHSLHCT